MPHLGYRPSEEHKRKISASKKGVSIWGGERGTMPWMSEEKHHDWKGNEVGYNALHDWVNQHKGKATVCENCGSLGGKKGCHWANISGEYKRDLNDYKSLCPKCHWDFDRERRLALRA